MGSEGRPHIVFNELLEETEYGSRLNGHLRLVTYRPRLTIATKNSFPLSQPPTQHTRQPPMHFPSAMGLRRRRNFVSMRRVAGSGGKTLAWRVKTPRFSDPGRTEKDP